ncbi:MAG: HAD-IIB family hydrolase [Solobacterium sp.]|nr:HAD-IIB family hydrolase [Solobacterium sp.]
MKILMSDYDGTLRIHEPQGSYIRPGDIRAITAFQEAGNLFGICTGRPVYWLKEDLDPRVQMDLIVASSGAVVEDCRTGTNLFRKDLPREMIDNLLGRMDEYIEFSVHGLKERYVIKSLNHPTINTVSAGEIPDTAISGISICAGTVEKAKTLSDYINDAYGDSAVAFQNIEYIDIIHKDCSKGTGILKLKEVLKPEVIAGIGDSFNDIPMLDACDISFTFDFSDPQVQEHADYIVHSIEEAIGLL